MIKNTCRFLFLTIIFYLPLFSFRADAFQAMVSPTEISPGDAFIIRIEGAENPGSPSAEINKKPLYFSGCGGGCFIAVGAVGIDTEPGDHTVLVSADAHETTLTLIVKPVEFPTINLSLPKEQVFLKPEDQARANREAERLSSIWNKVTERLWEGNFIRPIENEVSTVFGVKRIMNREKTSIHRGVDFRGKRGEKVRAFNTGRVVLADDLFYGGNTLVLDHGQGIYSIYMHLSKFNVKIKDIVSKGSVIGRIGSSGRATGPHLHFGVKIHNINSNPLSLLELAI
jgi:hypothetical protein